MQLAQQQKVFVNDFALQQFKGRGYQRPGQHQYKQYAKCRCQHALTTSQEQGEVQIQEETQPQELSKSIELDTILERELSENGFRSTRRTKIVATIGPASDSPQILEEMASCGMNVARLNMSHGTHDWHKDVIAKIRQLNKEKGYSIAIMVDTQGSEVATEVLESPIHVKVGELFVFTVRPKGVSLPASDCKRVIRVNYDAFVDDVRIGDQLMVDGGMVLFQVISMAGPDVECQCIDPGIILSQANLTMRRNGSIVRGRNAMLPVLSSKDWVDIDFAINQEVDFISVSFVKTADILVNLKSYISTRRKPGQGQIEVISKIESYDSIPNLPGIIDASDAVMIARGDLGAQIPAEDVPSVQKEIVLRCRRNGKAVLVASHLLQSMMELPIPTRAEVADVADVVRQYADAVMLSGETAVGMYPTKSVKVLREVLTSVEEWCRTDGYGELSLPQIAVSQDGAVSEQLCISAVEVANKVNASAIFVYTRRGYMANFVSRCRPDCPIFAFTDRQDVRHRMNLRWGVMPFWIEFAEGNPEKNVERTFELLKARDLVESGDLVVVISDIRQADQKGSNQVIRSVQVRHVS